jgi:hypothetical protein
LSIRRWLSIRAADDSEGTARRAAWQLFNNVGDPRLPTVETLAKALGVQPKDLLSRVSAVDENAKLAAELRAAANEQFVRLAVVIASAERAVQESRKLVEQARALREERRSRPGLPPRPVC